MKIAISSTGPNLDDTVEARFGRCPYFLVVDPATMEFEALPNPNRELGGGAGIQSAKLMTENGVSVVLTGNCGPNAVQVFEKGGIKMVTGVSGIVREAVQQFSTGSLKTTTTAQAAGRYSGRIGRGRSRGRDSRGGHASPNAGARFKAI